MGISIGGGISIVGGVSMITETDPSFNSVSLLLPGTGTNGSTVFTNDAPTGFAMTGFGNAQISTAQSKWGNGSIYLDGVGDYVASTTNRALNANSTFTLEGWIRPASLSFSGQPLGLFFSGTTTLDTQRVMITLNTNGNITYYVQTVVNVSESVSTAAGVITAGAWSYITVVRNVNLVTIYVNGISVASGTISLSPTLASNTYIGFIRSGAALRYYQGYINDFRITNGVARYTSNFEPPVVPLPLS